MCVHTHTPLQLFPAPLYLPLILLHYPTVGLYLGNGRCTCQQLRCKFSHLGFNFLHLTCNVRRME